MVARFRRERFRIWITIHLVRASCKGISSLILPLSVVAFFLSCFGLSTMSGFLSKDIPKTDTTVGIPTVSHYGKPCFNMLQQHMRNAAGNAPVQPPSSSSGVEPPTLSTSAAGNLSGNAQAEVTPNQARWLRALTHMQDIFEAKQGIRPIEEVAVPPGLENNMLVCAVYRFISVVNAHSEVWFVGLGKMCDFFGMHGRAPRSNRSASLRDGGNDCVGGLRR